jgi:hypothetical protein
MRQTHDDLTGTDDLPRLRQSLDYHAVPVGEQDSVTSFIAGDACLGLRRIELRACGLGVRLDFVVGRCRNGTPGDKVAEAQLVVRSLARSRPGSDNGLVVCAHGEREVRGIDTHERLSALDGLSRIDQAFQDFPGNPEPQVALHAGRDDAGERTL